MHLLCRTFTLLLCLYLVWGCGSKARRPPVTPAISTVDAVVSQVAHTFAEAETTASAPAPSSATAAKESSRRHPPRLIDDRYGPGALGPRILSHESEVLDVAPQRMNVYLLAEPASDSNKPDTASAVAADKAVAFLKGKVDIPSLARAARPVRVWEVREPRSATESSPLTPAVVDTRAYLSQLGIHSIYDLSPQSRRLALTRNWLGGISPLGQNLVRGGAGALSARAATSLTPRQWEEMIHEAGRLFGLDPQFIAAMIKVESNFDHLAVSSKGAQGAMQIMPSTQALLGLEDPFDVRANIHAGCAFIRELLVQYGSPELALAAYNAGPGAVDRYNGIPPYAETQAYVRKVMTLWQGEGMPQTTERKIRRNDKSSFVTLGKSKKKRDSGKASGKKHKKKFRKEE